MNGLIKENKLWELLFVICLQTIVVNQLDFGWFSCGDYLVVVYDRNQHFGLGLIPKLKHKLADTFGRYRDRNHISIEKFSYQ